MVLFYQKSDFTDTETMFITWCTFFLCFCAILVQANVLKNSIKNLKIVYTSDIHSKFDPGEDQVLNCNHANARKKLCYNNFAKMVHLINEERKDRNTIVLHTGDTVQNDIFFTPDQQDLTLGLINLLELDAAALGIGDFDYGTEYLIDYLDFLNEQRFAANVEISNSSDLAEFIEKSTIISANGLKIGIISYVASNTTETSDLGDVKLLNEVQAIREEAEHLKNKNLDLVIALGQTSMENAKKISQIQDLDLVISHSNYHINNDLNPPSFLPGNTFDLLSPDDKHPAYLMQTFGFIDYIGVLEIEFDAARKFSVKNRFKFIESDTPTDKSVLQALVYWGNQKFNKQTCKTPMMQKKYFNQECPLGLAITDAILDADLGDFNAVIYNARGFVSSSNCISNPESPTISMEDMLNYFPSDELIRVRLSGEKLKILLEKNTCDDFLHVAGLKLHYNLTAPCGSRLNKEEISFFTSLWRTPVEPLEIFLPSTFANHQPKNKTVDLIQTYSVILPRRFFDKESRKILNGTGFEILNVSVHDVIEDYFAIRRVSEITPVGGRITFLLPDGTESSFYRLGSTVQPSENQKIAEFDKWSDKGAEISARPIKRNESKNLSNRLGDTMADMTPIGLNIDENSSKSTSTPESTTILSTTTAPTATDHPILSSSTKTPNIIDKTTVTNAIASIESRISIPETTTNVIFDTTEPEVTTEAIITTTHRNDTDGYTSEPLVETTTQKTGKSAIIFSYTWSVFMLISSYISSYIAVKFLLLI